MILLVWLLSMTLDIVIKDYSPEPTVHLAMMGLVGSIFTAGVLRKD